MSIAGCSIGNSTSPLRDVLGSRGQSWRARPITGWGKSGAGREKPKPALFRFYKMNLPLNIELWPDLYRELYEERAGILQFQANFPKWRAEIMAEKDIRKQASQEWEPLT